MKEFICIVCPKGCRLKIDDNLNVTGNLCQRGVAYARAEITNPVRTITSTVRVKNRKATLVSIKTSLPAPKEKMFEIMKELNHLQVLAPIQIGDILLKNILGLKIDIVATKNID